MKMGLEVAKKWPVPMSGDDLNSLIEFLNDNSEEMSLTKLGIQLEFLERNGFDFGLDIFTTGALLDKYINDYFVPEYRYHFDGPPEEERVPYDVVRAIALQLRDYYRDKFNIAKLTDEEKQSWNFQTTYPDRPWLKEKTKRHNRGQKHNLLESFQLNENQVKDLGLYMRKYFPEAYKLMPVIELKSKEQGYTGANSINRVAVINAISDATEACFGHELETNQTLTYYDGIIKTLLGEH